MRRHDPHLMAERLQLAGPMMRCCAGLDADQTRWQLVEEGDDLASPQLPADHDFARFVNSVNLKDVLRQIQTDPANLLHRTAPLIVDRQQLPLSGT